MHAVAAGCVAGGDVGDVFAHVQPGAHECCVQVAAVGAFEKVVFAGGQPHGVDAGTADAHQVECAAQFEHEDRLCVFEFEGGSQPLDVAFADTAGHQLAGRIGFDRPDGSGNCAARSTCGRSLGVAGNGFGDWGEGWFVWP